MSAIKSANTVGTETRPWCCVEGAARCDGMAGAVNGDVGTMVETVQRQILRYYTDVGNQASESFESAKLIATWGFALLVVTIMYAIGVDIAGYAGKLEKPEYAGMGVGTIGLVAGGIVEVIAGVQFVLYGKATKQFGAFHICLERTHRYLLAYKIAEKINDNRDQTLEKIVCIMANAPMISRADIDGMDSGGVTPPTATQTNAASTNASSTQ